ncbi:MAG: helix-turn-helix transcriptional regulator [Sphingobacteriaceae bacterium]|jgi:excisionase family DNA binding protein
MEAITIVKITPEELEILIEKSVKKVLAELKELKQEESNDRWMNMQELCEYIPDRPSRATVYGWVNTKSIPVHKGGKKLRFLKSEIDKWMQS